VAPPPDQTCDGNARARGNGRRHQGQGRVDSRECAPAPTADRAPTAGEAPRVHAARSAAARPLGAPGPWVAAALLIVQPDTLLRWHRHAFRLVWRAKSATALKRPQIAPTTVALIERLAAENPLWGAERVRGELIKLGVRVGKRTVQRHMRSTRPPRPRGQTWATFLHNHAQDVWACDFLPVIDLGFRALFAFFIVDIGSRRVVHIAVTRHPTDAWVAQQLREATPFGVSPRFLIRDNDATFGPQFARVAAGSRIEVLRTPVRVD